jgi:hypothetical protein
VGGGEMPPSQERLGGREKRIGEEHQQLKEHHLHDIPEKDMKGSIEEQPEGSLITEHHQAGIIWTEEGHNLVVKRIDIIKGCREKNSVEIDAILKDTERTAASLTLRGGIKDPIMKRGENHRIGVDQGKDQVLDTDTRSEENLLRI